MNSNRPVQAAAGQRETCWSILFWSCFTRRTLHRASAWVMCWAIALIDVWICNCASFLALKSIMPTFRGYSEPLRPPPALWKSHVRISSHLAADVQFLPSPPAKCTTWPQLQPRRRLMYLFINLFRFQALWEATSALSLPLRSFCSDTVNVDLWFPVCFHG